MPGLPGEHTALKDVLGTFLVRYQKSGWLHCPRCAQETMQMSRGRTRRGGGGPAFQDTCVTAGQRKGRLIYHERPGGLSLRFTGHCQVPGEWETGLFS